MTRAVRIVVLLLVGASASAGLAAAADLEPRTIAAFERYVQLTETRMEGELRGDDRFLWLDRQPEARRLDDEATLRAGGIAVARLETRDLGRQIDTPDGLIHHWVGTVFIPNVSPQQVETFMQRYDRYQEVYAPNVRRSSLLARDGNRYRVRLTLFMKKVVSVVLNTEYDIRYVPLGSGRIHVRSYATRIAEVENPDTADAREKPVGHDSGYLWRFNNYCGLEPRSGGTYVQCETVSLSRDVPFGFGWLIGPFVTSIPKESLEFTLRAMRSALTGGA